MPESTTLDETLLRLHRYGPEFEGWLSNHGPMAVEAMERRGQESRVTGWTDEYVNASTRHRAGPGARRARNSTTHSAIPVSRATGSRHFAHS